MRQWWAWTAASLPTPKTTLQLLGICAGAGNQLHAPCAKEPAMSGSLSSPSRMSSTGLCDAATARKSGQACRTSLRLGTGSSRCKRALKRAITTASSSSTARGGSPHAAKRW